MPAPILKQITVSSKSNPLDRNLYTVVELQGAASFSTATQSDVRVGDKVTFDDLNNYLNGSSVNVLVIVKL